MFDLLAHSFLQGNNFPRDFIRNLLKRVENYTSSCDTCCMLSKTSHSTTVSFTGLICLVHTKKTIKKLWAVLSRLLVLPLTGIYILTMHAVILIILPLNIWWFWPNFYSESENSFRSNYAGEVPSGIPISMSNNSPSTKYLSDAIGASVIKVSSLKCTENFNSCPVHWPHH